MSVRAIRALLAPALLAAAACGSTRTEVFRVEAVLNETEEPVPCAVLVDGVVQRDAQGEPLRTPADVSVTFPPDPSGRAELLPVKLLVLPLIEEAGGLRLPQEDSSDAPRHLWRERVVRPADSRTQLFFLFANSQRKRFRYPRPGNGVQ